MSAIKNAPTHATEAEVAASQGFEGEQRIDPHRQALQRAAQRDHARRTQPGTWANLPNGEAVKINDYRRPSFPDEKAGRMLATPELMLLHPKPPFNFARRGEPGRAVPRYSWRQRIETSKDGHRDSETAMYHRSGKIRYIETKEINPKSEIAVYTEYATPNNTYVTFKSMILCEIVDPQLAYDLFLNPSDRAIARVVDLPIEVRSEQGTHIDGVTEVEAKISDSRQGG